MTITAKNSHKVITRAHLDGFRSSYIINGDQVIEAKSHATEKAAIKWAKARLEKMA